MTLDDIPADVEMVLAEGMQRLFRAAGCDPACHVCGEHIQLGEGFGLFTILKQGLDEEVKAEIP